jgi:hypothetical protein
MKFLIENRLVVEATSMEAAIIDFAKNRPWSDEAISIIELGEVKRYRVVKFVEEVDYSSFEDQVIDYSSFEDQVLKELESGKPINRQFTASEVIKLFDMEGESKVKLMKESPSGRLLVCPIKYVGEPMLSDFQRALIAEVESCDSIGRIFTPEQIVEVNKLNQMGRIEIEYRNGICNDNYRLIRRNYV